MTVRAGVLFGAVFVRNVEKPLDSFHPYESHGSLVAYQGEKINGIIRALPAWPQ